MRALLNVAPTQADLARLLLDLLPQLCEEECAPDSFGSQAEATTLPQLLLGQFRWCAEAGSPGALLCRGRGEAAGGWLPATSALLALRAAAGWTTCPTRGA